MLNKNIKTVFLSILISALVCSQIGNAGYIGDPSTVIRLNKFSLIPYKWAIEQFNATAYQSFNSTGYTIQSLDDGALIQACIDDVTAVGGEILIVSGTYTASVTLKNNIRLVIEKGATGITVAIDAGATCVLEDYNNSITWYYSSGVLMLQYNNINGAIAGVYATFTEGHFTQLYVNGVNMTDSLAGVTLPYTYTVYKSGSTYYMEDSDGNVDYSSTDANKTLNFAVGNSTDVGAVFVKTGYYPNVNIKIPHDKITTIIGEGMNNTVIDAGAGANAKAFEVYDTGVYTDYWLKLITIKDMTVSATNGYCFYYDFAGFSSNGNQGLCSAWVTLENIYFNSFLYGIWANTPYKWSTLNLNFHSTTNNAVGIYFCTTANGGFHSGDSYFARTFIQLDGTGGTGLYLDGTGAAGAFLNLMTFDHLQVLALTGITYGILINTSDATKGCVVYNNFYNLYLEVATYGIYFVGRADYGGSYGMQVQNCFTGGYITGGVMSMFGNGKDPAHKNYFRGIQFDSGQINWTDAEAATMYFENCCYPSSDLLDAFVGFGGNYKHVIMTNCAGVDLEDYGVNATAVDGGIQAFTLSATPTYVFVSSGNATATIVGADNLAVDHFHYCLHDDAGVAVVGVQTVYWYAVYEPYP